MNQFTVSTVLDHMSLASRDDNNNNEKIPRGSFHPPDPVMREEVVMRKPKRLPRIPLAEIEEITNFVERNRHAITEHESFLLDRMIDEYEDVRTHEARQRLKTFLVYLRRCACPSPASTPTYAQSRTRTPLRTPVRRFPNEVATPQPRTTGRISLVSYTLDSPLRRTTTLVDLDGTPVKMHRSRMTRSVRLVDVSTPRRRVAVPRRSLSRSRVNINLDEYDGNDSEGVVGVCYCGHCPRAYEYAHTTRQIKPEKSHPLLQKLKSRLFATKKGRKVHN